MATLHLLRLSPTRGEPSPWAPFSHPGSCPILSPPFTKPGQVSNHCPMEVLDKAWDPKTYHLWVVLGDWGVLVVMGWGATVWGAMDKGALGWEGMD